MVYLACCPVTAGTDSNHNPELDKWKEIDLWTKIMSTLDICNFKWRNPKTILMTVLQSQSIHQNNLENQK